MDLSSVTPFGLIAYSVVKFAGYIFAFVLLTRTQPAIQASALSMAIVRSVSGVLAGGMLYFGWDAARHQFSAFYNFSYEVWPYYSVLFVLRVLLWAATIYFFFRTANLSQRKVWLYALGGTVWSCVMDIPAALFAVFSGGVLFC